ncbi:hypothetical protein F4678DRAFT_443518 [Xylaria arbuscula]|nr:hypothetical protein F4678DRAFT_443518 [Xylaria arbuscula]
MPRGYVPVFCKQGSSPGRATDRHLAARAYICSRFQVRLLGATLGSQEIRPVRGVAGPSPSQATLARIPALHRATLSACYTGPQPEERAEQLAKTYMEAG